MLAVLIVCAVPDGLLASFGIAPPFAITGDGWRWYLHLGSYATVLAFLVVEYAFRRWHLRHIPHVPLPVFVARLVRRWPALARSVMHDAPMSALTHDARSDIVETVRIACARIRRCPDISPAIRSCPASCCSIASPRRSSAPAMAASRASASVKFLAPLLPDENAELRVARDGARVRFRIDRDGAPILRGEGELA